MMQVKSMQVDPRKLASRMPSDARTIAQRKRDLIAQVEKMALSDLSKVSSRLKGLHADVERLDGRKWTYYELSEATGIPHRTFQSWENGEVENRDGKGYDKMARFYSRKLNREITRQWILFGDQGDSQPTPEEVPTLQEAAGLNEVLAELAAVRVALKEQQSLLESVLRNQEAGK